MKVLRNCTSKRLSDIKLFKCHKNITFIRYQNFFQKLIFPSNVGDLHLAPKETVKDKKLNYIMGMDNTECNRK